jgi:hypothetical protein
MPAATRSSSTTCLPGDGHIHFSSGLWFDTPELPTDPETIRIIMKDGKVFKNTL